MESEYRADQFSVLEIAKRFGVTESAIRQRAKRYGWQRPLASKVRKAIQEKLARADADAASDAVGDASGNAAKQQRARDDAEIIHAASTRGMEVVTSHRKDIQQLHALKRILAERLSEVLDGLKPSGPCLGERESPGDLLVKLSRATAQLIPLERKAYNLDEEAGVTVSLTDAEGLRRSMAAKLNRIAQTQESDA